MKIVIGSDHAGYSLKSLIIDKFGDQIEFADYGCDSGKVSVDYPDIAKVVCQNFIKLDFDFGILICGSGIGISIAANRFSNIRAALCHSEETAILSRQHNNANILCLGSRIISDDVAFSVIESFIHTSFLAGRHKNRVEKLC